MRRVRLVLLAVVTPFLASCSTTDLLDDLPAAVTGIWQSQGYGYVFSVDDKKLRAYDRAGSTCIFSSSNTEVIPYLLSGSQLAFSEQGRLMDLTFANEPYTYRFERLAELPATCTNAPVNTPAGNFNAFADFFTQHYAFFELFNVDWPSRVAHARAKLRDDMDDAALFDLMSKTMAPVQDAHVDLTALIDGAEQIFSPEQSTLGQALATRAETTGRDLQEVQQELLRELWIDGISNRVLGGQGTIAAGGFIHYGKLVDNPNVGYLAVQRETGFAGNDSDDGAEDLRVLNEVLDQAIAQWQRDEVVAVVLDLSVNFGGSDFMGRAVAERFAQEPGVAYSKRAYDHAGSELQTISLEPFQGARFNGPVVVLTSNTTVSAGEILTMAMRSLPQVIHVGEATRGSLSDRLGKTLPNGWELSLSNEIYVDHEGKLWEGPGIKPEQEFTVLAPEDPLASHVQAVHRAGTIAIGAVD